MRSGFQLKRREISGNEGLSQSLLNEVRFPILNTIEYRRIYRVAIPSKWGQVSNTSETNMFAGSRKSQSLLNEVRFPINYIKKICGSFLVAIPSKWGQVSNLQSPKKLVGCEFVAIPSKWGQVSNQKKMVVFTKREKSQSLLNEVRFPMEYCRAINSILLKSQSLLNEVRFPMLTAKVTASVLDCRNPF